MYEASIKYVDGYTLQELKSGLEMLLTEKVTELSEAELDMVAGGSKNSSAMDLPVKLFNDIINTVDGLGDALARWLK